MVAQKDLLDKWSQKVHPDGIEETLAKVKNALAEYKNFPPTAKVAFYLHGSHKHATSIAYQRPLDIIVEITSVTGDNRSDTNPFHGKKYTFLSFKADVLQSLQNAFGRENICEGDCAIKISGASDRLPANVLVSFKYKYFIKYGRDETQKAGVAFYHRKNQGLVLNFPKQHLANESIKDRGAQGNFVPTVRIFKNIRNFLAEIGALDAKRVPTYFLESFISNAPSGMFTSQYVDSIDNLLDFWSKNAWTNYLAIDGFRPLWGEYPQFWNIEDATYFLDALKKNWKPA